MKMPSQLDVKKISHSGFSARLEFLNRSIRHGSNSQAKSNPLTCHCGRVPSISVSLRMLRSALLMKLLVCFKSIFLNSHSQRKSNGAFNLEIAAFSAASLMRRRAGKRKSISRPDVVYTCEHWHTYTNKSPMTACTREKVSTWGFYTFAHCSAWVTFQASFFQFFASCKAYLYGALYRALSCEMQHDL